MIEEREPVVGAPPTPSVAHPVLDVLRLVLAAIFIYAALPKLLHPDQFAENLLDYAVLPVQWINLTAVWLPVFELLVGVTVLLGVWVRAGALAMAGMTAVFLTALVWVQSGPTPLPCSCFSTDPGNAARTWFSLWQEAVLVLLAGALWVGYWPHVSDPPIHIGKRLMRGALGALLVVLVLASGIVVGHHQRLESAAALVQQEAAAVATAPLPRLLDLGSAGCEACQKMAPTVAELSQELQGKVNVQFVDVVKNPSYIEKYNLVATPTQIFFDASGRQIGRHEGVLTKAQVLAQLRKLRMGGDLGPLGN